MLDSTALLELFTLLHKSGDTMKDVKTVIEYTKTQDEKTLTLMYEELSMIPNDEGVEALRIIYNVILNDFQS